MSDDVQVEAAEGAEPAEAADAAVEDVSAEEAGVADAEAAALAEIEAEEQEVNADGAAAVAGELFGGPDANQAVHSVESEGFTPEAADEDVVEEV